MTTWTDTGANESGQMARLGRQEVIFVKRGFLRQEKYSLANLYLYHAQCIMPHVIYYSTSSSELGYWLEYSYYMIRYHHMAAYQGYLRVSEKTENTLPTSGLY